MPGGQQSFLVGTEVFFKHTLLPSVRLWSPDPLRSNDVHPPWEGFRLLGLARGNVAAAVGRAKALKTVLVFPTNGPFQEETFTPES